MDELIRGEWAVFKKKKEGQAPLIPDSPDKLGDGWHMTFDMWHIIWEGWVSHSVN